MTELRPYGGGEKPIRTVQQVIDTLKEPGAVYFPGILEDLTRQDITEENKNALGRLVIEHFESALTRGQFQDLQGVGALLEFLGYKEFILDEAWMGKITHFYNRFPYMFLLGLSPSLFNDRLSDGREYNRIEYAKERLRAFGATDEELSDESVSFLMNMRELLIHMHTSRVSPDKLQVQKILHLE